MIDEASPHSSAWKLIPWLVNGRIDGAEQAWLRQHLDGCAACREQYMLECRIRDAMLADLHDDGDDVARAGLGRLFERIDREDAASASWRAAAATAPSPAASRDVRRRRGALRLLAAAVIIEAIGLGALGTALLMRGDPSAASAEYRTLSAPTPAVAAASVRFVPAPSMTVATLRDALAKAGLYIVDSRPDSAIYGLALTPAAARAGVPASVQLQQAIAELASRPDVLLVEPIAPVGK